MSSKLAALVRQPGCEAASKNEERSDEFLYADIARMKTLERRGGLECAVTFERGRSLSRARCSERAADRGVRISIDGGPVPGIGELASLPGMSVGVTRAARGVGQWKTSNSFARLELPNA